MKLKKISCVLVSIVVTFVIFCSFSYAADTGLIVVRGSTGNLYRATFSGNTFNNNWVQISGSAVTTDPTVYYDPYSQRWILIVVNSAGAIWRSTFDKDAVHNNDWVQLAGSSPGPAGAAAKIWVPNAEAVYATDSITLSGTASNLLSRSWTADEGGFVLVRAWSALHVYHVNGTNSVVNFGLSETSGGSDLLSGHYFIDATHPTGYQCIPINISRWVSVGAGTTTTVYFTATFSGAASASARAVDRSMDIQYIYY